MQKKVKMKSFRLHLAVRILMLQVHLMMTIITLKNLITAMRLHLMKTAALIFLTRIVILPPKK